MTDYVSSKSRSDSCRSYHGFQNSHIKYSCLLVLVSVLVNCGPPVLDEALAKRLIERALAESPYVASTDVILPLMRQSVVDYTKVQTSGSEPSAIVARFCEVGHVKQTATLQTYPDIGGAWLDTYYARGASGSPKDRLRTFLGFPVDTWQNRNAMALAMQSSMSNEVHGTRYWVKHAANKRSVAGSVSPDGQVRFETGAEQGEGTWTYVEDGGAAYLVNNMDGEEPTYSNKNRVWRRVGAPSRARVQLRTYEYEFSQNVKVNAGAMDVGKVVVDTVSDLKLDTETRATATFRWRAQLNSVGRSLFLESVPAGEGVARFEKKPDGSWKLAGQPGL